MTKESDMMVSEFVHIYKIFFTPWHTLQSQHRAEINVYENSKSFTDMSKLM